jgi:hypothetical protein
LNHPNHPHRTHRAQNHRPARLQKTHRALDHRDIHGSDAHLHGSRQYAANGERRSFALLRPIVDKDAQEKVRQLVLEAFAEYEEHATV